MRRGAFLMPIALAGGLVAAGCSGDKSPTSPTPASGGPSTVWVEDGGYWRASVDGTDFDTFAGYSFAERDTVPASKMAAADWDVAFRREVVKLNGGSSGDGDVQGADLGAVDYALVDSPAAGSASWLSDTVEYMIRDWYTYNLDTHQIEMTQNVYSMVDATGEHYVKFRIDSLSGDLGPTSMGDVHLTYYYQPAAGDLSLPGPAQTAVVSVGSGVVYFDFSTGTQVDPTDPANSLDWDIRFDSFNLALNSGPSGSGAAAAFYAYTTLSDPTDIDAFTEQPADAPLFPGVAGSALTDWYNYNADTHQLSSKNHVYLVRSGDRLYKMQILSYYADRGGQPVSAVYSFKWNEL